ncbi:hypothetical protein D3C85_1375810 [compost metagenome]
MNLYCVFDFRSQSLEKAFALRGMDRRRPSPPDDIIDQVGRVERYLPGDPRLIKRSPWIA